MDKNFEAMLSDRLGMFVHFGLYSSFGGKYKGKDIEGLGEWIQRRAEIPIAEYEAHGRKYFNPDKDYAINLVRRAKAAGLRYVVLTSKHHDGFCLFKSDADSYNAYEFFGRDFCRELADACRAEGLELGFYYSHALDWHERNAAGNHTLSHPDAKSFNRNYWDYPDDNIDFEEYFRRKCLPQVTELLTNYGDLKCIWFDYPHDITKEQSLELRQLVKKLQPGCLINSRIGHGLCDYYSLGDNCLPSTPAKVPTECLVTLNETWGYKSCDQKYKTSESIIDIICRTLTADSTLLINVGPMADGSLTPETEKILEDVGKWTSRNAEAIYGGIKGNPFKAIFKWGYVSSHENSVYIYLKEARESLSLSGFESAPKSVTLVGDCRKVDFSYENKTVSFKTLDTNEAIPVYRLDFDGTPEISREIDIDSTRESIPVVFASVANPKSPDDAKPIPLEYDVEQAGLVKKKLILTRIETTSHWSSPEDMLLWEANFLEAGEYEAEIICAAPSFETTCAEAEANIPCILSVNGESHPIAPEIKDSYNISVTGSFNMRYVKDGGVFSIGNTGKHRVTLKKTTDELGYGILEVRFIKK